jgi:Glycosyl hydrolases family 2, TIM barrel domain/Glycosyl hydrolases family 2, sugar binding domain/Glycosyl hydrolases family 2
LLFGLSCIIFVTVSKSNLKRGKRTNFSTALGILLHISFSRFTSILLPFFLLITVLSAFSEPLFYVNGAKSRPEVLNYSSSTRSIIDLSGTWEYSLDNGKTWGTVAVPSAATISGKIIFTRKFDVPSDQISNNGFLFVAYGINYEAEVFVNEIFIGKHEGGYTSFSFLIPSNTLQVGRENVIRIVVNDQLNARSTLPLRQQIWGWKNYGGIFRDIFIVATPPVWVDNVKIGMDGLDAKEARVSVTAVVSARDLPPDSVHNSLSYQFHVEVMDKSTGEVVGKSDDVPLKPESNQDETIQSKVSIPDPKLWSLEAPSLYLVRSVVETVESKDVSLEDEYTVPTGLRTITRSGSTLLLNGSPIELRGVAWGEDTPSHGSSMTYEEMERDVVLIKNLGANAIRFAFHPPHPFMVQLCDQYGLLALEEIPLYDAPAEIMAHENYRMLAENYLREMIRRDRNHPSVIAWGFGAGFESVSDQAKPMIEQLNSVAKESDTRLTYYVSSSVEDKENSSIVDIAGIGLSEPDIKDFKQSLLEWKRSHPAQPVILARYGREIEVNNRNGYSDPMSQESQARYLMQRYEAVKAANIAGSFIWSFSDWRGARPIMTVKLNNPELYTQGIVEFNREKKIAYDVMRSMFLGEKVAALPIGTHIGSPPVSYVLLGLGVLIFFAWFYNGNRRFRENINRAFLRPYNFFADVRDQRILSNAHTFIIAVIVSLTLAIVFSSIVYHFRTSTIFDYSLTQVLVVDSVKLLAVRLVWNPLRCIAAVTAGTLLWMVITTCLIKLGSTLIRTKVSWFHSYSVAVWSTLPMIIFIPLGMVLYRIMESDMYVLPVLVILAFVMLWIFFRTLKGIAVVYDIASPKVYSFAISGIIIAGAVVYAYLDHTYSTTAYIHYMISTIIPASS